MRITLSNQFRLHGGPWQRGFTLLEAIVVIAILGILAAVAAPSFKSAIDSSRRTAYANQLFEDLALARSEAIKRRVRVSVCPSADGTPRSCSPNGVNPSDWSIGWIVFTDPAGTGAYDSSSGTLLKVHEALPTGWNAQKNDTNNFISYAASGFLPGAVGSTIAICPGTSVCTTDASSNPKTQTHVVISSTGRVRIQSYK